MTPLYPLLTPLLLLTHQALAAPNDQHQQHQQKPPHVTKRAVQAARRNSAKITSPPLPLSLSSSTSSAPLSCPTTLTVENQPGCGGCTTTEYATTFTQSVDCGGSSENGERCESLVTSTLYHRGFGICPVCVGGVQTTFDGAGTSTVTSCLVGTTLSSSVSTSMSSTPESYSANSKGI